MKSAQQKMNEFLDECRETRDAINQLEAASREHYEGSYAYACGYFATLLGDIIAELPKARRAQLREQLYREAQKQKNLHLADTIKEA